MGHTMKHGLAAAILLLVMPLSAGSQSSPPTAAAGALPDSITSITARIDRAREAGDYAACAALMRRRLAAARGLLEPGHPDLAPLLYELADILHRDTQYVEAESLCQQAFEIQHAHRGPADPATLEAMRLWGVLLVKRRDFARAQPVLEEALRLLAEQGLDHNVAYADGLLKLGTLHQFRGDHLRALPLLYRALAVHRWAPEPDQGEIARLLRKIADILRIQGDPISAEPLLRESLDLYNRVYGPDHLETSRALNSLAALLAEKEQYDEAEAIFKHLLDQRRQLPEKEHPWIAAYLYNLGVLNWSRGNLDTAESYFREAHELKLKILAPDDITLGMGYINLALVQLEQGDIEEAATHAAEGLRICRAACGPAEPNLAYALSQMGRIRLAQGRTHDAERLLGEAAAAFERAREVAGTGSARATFQESPCLLLAAARLELGSEESAWRAAERGMGRLLEEVLAAPGPSVGHDLAEHTEALSRRGLILQQQIESLHSARSAHSAAAGVDAVLDSLRRAQVEVVAERLAAAEQLVLSGGTQITPTLPLATIQRSLSEDEALVGWIHVEVTPSDHRRWGYVIRREEPVHWARLPGAAGEAGVSSARDIDGVAEELQRTMAGTASWPLLVPTTEKVDPLAHSVWASWFRPLERFLDGVRRIVAAPAGILVGLPLEALRDDRGATLADRFSFCYVPSASAYTLLQARAAGRSRKSWCALLVGDPPFCAKHLEAMEREAPIGTNTQQGAPTAVALEPDLLRRAAAGNAGALAKLPRLTGTRRELGHLTALVPKATLLLGKAATERAFLASVAGDGGTYDLVHVATHALVDPRRPHRCALVLSQVDRRDPLQAVLSGDHVYDGLVTVEEIGSFCRLDADLVTLSGCRTAVGERVEGEGQLGLAHAFLLRGARSVLVSLWTVNDWATELLMRRFYENLTGRYEEDRGSGPGFPMGKAEALRDAKRWLRGFEDGTGQQPFRHPAYWSAFVLMGASH